MAATGEFVKATPGFLPTKDSGAAGLVWDVSALGEYLGFAEGEVPGTKMAFPGLKKPEEVENVIAYLRSVSE